MNIKIREENENDYLVIYNLVKDAFESAEHSDGYEQNLVDKIRLSEEYIPELSLVAVVDDKIVGHIMFTKTLPYSNGLIAMAPLSVSPQHQKMGIGKKLIEAAHIIAKKLKYKGVIVLGSEKYYPKFGYVEASKFNIYPPFDVPSENFMALEIEVNSMKDYSGKFKYSKCFGE